MLKHITKFNQIKHIPNSLIVLDIDETIIKFDKINSKWWKNTFNKHFAIRKDYDLTDTLCLNEWIHHIKITEPELVDDEICDWINLMKKAKCDFIFLTARNPSLEAITYKQLEKKNISNDKIYFNANKGEELSRIVNTFYTHIENIIVVDDLKTNLVDIQNAFLDTDFNLHLYVMNG